MSLRFRFRSDDSDLDVTVGWSLDINAWQWTGLAFLNGTWVSAETQQMTVAAQYEENPSIWTVTVRDESTSQQSIRFVRVRVHGSGE